MNIFTTFFAPLAKVFGGAGGAPTSRLQDPSYLLGKEAGDFIERVNFGYYSGEHRQQASDRLRAKLDKMIEAKIFNFDLFDEGYDNFMEYPYTDGLDFLFLKSKFPEKFAAPESAPAP